MNLTGTTPDNRCVVYVLEQVRLDKGITSVIVRITSKLAEQKQIPG